ncbi:hypothetical protein BUALT_Bualt03G0165200 [Buddleja alternifolia]|uniref:BTB domain-containing protein n=1 Tax=Buddleja alternifolia TaxID=168488 RepID=A0AAV6XYN4_9LAMI|nr:hypothetical protein BUALT_Bualt03G0165200 [Buddleja alternifolia]
MRSSAKHRGAAENNRCIGGHVLTLHRRLYHALNLGCRSSDNREKWHCSDIEIQRMVLRSIDAFLDCISSETLQHPLVKDSVVDMVRALGSILEFKSQSILRLASTVSVKMVNILPSSSLQSHVLDLICPLANLLSLQQLQVAKSSAMALNFILSKLSSRQERELLQILEDTKAVDYLVHNVKQFYVGDKPIEYFQEMASLLSKILWRWPSFRFCVWNDSRFLDVLDATKLMSESSLKVAGLQLYTNIALCGNGAEKLLENGEGLVRMMVNCMESSSTHSVRVEAFKLARCLALSRSGCMKMLNICCEPLVKAVTSALRKWSSLPEKLAKSEMSVMEEACRFASITRWAGDHHIYFWKAGVDRLLLNLLLNNYPKIHQLQHELSTEDLIIIVKESLDANFLPSLRPYLWDILGGLAANCAENFNHEMHGNGLRLLIMCSSFCFIKSIGTLRQISQNSLTNMTEGEAAARAVLMLVYSPCKYIASLARSVLCEVLELSGEDNVEYVLETVNARLSGKKFGLPGNLQVVLSLISLACYCSLQKYRKLVIKYQGMKTLVTFIMWWLNNPVHTKRASIVPHLRDSFSERSCCYQEEEWEGTDMLLLFSLWILGELLHHSANVKVHPSDNQGHFSEAILIQKLQEISRDYNSPGSRWYAAYVLSHYGLFGFPNKLGMKIGKSLGKKELCDLKLDLVNEEAVYVHEVILMVRCPSLLPPGGSVLEEKLTCGSIVKWDLGRNSIKEVRLSAHVDQQSLLKLLEYVYSGYLQAGEDLVKKLKIFARHCKLESLLQMLCRRNPKWGTPIPSFDLSPALVAAVHHFSDLLLEANTTQLEDWKCSSCPSLVPHLHVHKVMLESSCDYLRALFQSGMQESHSQTMKVPVSWESLNILVSWFYSDQLPVPKFDCLWDNSEPEEKLQQVQSYLELCWLAEFWFVEDLHEECYNIVISCLDSSRYLSTKIIQIAADLSLWKVAQVAANYMAPSYHHLRNSGELDALDSNLVEMVRAASVRLSREGSLSL